MNRDFFVLFDEDIIKSVNGMTKASSDLKSEIFKTVTMNREIDKNVIRKFLSLINEYLRFWDDYSEALGDKIKSTRGRDGIRTVEYNYIKDFIYGKYDYSSILEFADGVAKQIENKEIKKPSDVRDFFSYSVENAFNDQPDSVAGLLDTVVFNVSNSENSILVDKAEASLFNSVRNYRKLFDSNSRVMIYKSIQKVLEFLISQLPGLKLNLDWNVIDLKVAMINSIIDYMSYTLAAYSTRIFIIGKYAGPFIMAYQENAVTPIRESADNNEFCNIEVTILQKTDDLIFKDINKYEKFIDAINEFLTLIGASDFGPNKPSYYRPYIPFDVQQNNIILNSLFNNDFINFIVRKRYDVLPYSPKGTHLIALQDILKEYLINSKQGLSTSSTARQEILHIIKNCEPNEVNIKGYQKLAKDIYIASLVILGNIVTIINTIIEWKDSESSFQKYSLAASNAASEDLRMLRDIYCEIAGALFDKCRYIEAKLNILKHSENEKMVKDVSINWDRLPLSKSDLKLNDKMMKEVPDTTRMPINLTAEYSQAEFESLQFRDMLLAARPEFSDSLYYTEAFSIVDIINKIISLILGKAKSFETFFKNIGVDSAIKWTTTYHDELMAMDFTGKSMDALDYKNTITLPGGEAFKNNFIDGLSKFNKDILNDQKSADEFIKNLYDLDGSGIVYSWWYGDGANQEEAAKRYKNWILFCDKIADTGKEIEVKNFADAYLTTEVKAWIETVSSANGIRKGYADMSNSVKDSINKIKTEIASIQKTQEDQKKKDLEAQKKEANSTASEDNKQNGNANSTTTTTQSQQNNNSMNTPNTVNLEKFLNEVLLANQRLFLPISDYFIEAIRNSYKYLKEAYTINKAPNKNNTNAETKDDQNQ